MTKIKKIELIRDTETGHETEQKSIRKLKFYQIEDVLTKIHEVYKIIQEDENMSLLFAELFGEDEPVDEIALAKFTDEERIQIEADKQKAAEKRFFKGLAGSFPLLLLHLPKHAIELLVAASDVEKELLRSQDFETILDVYDAVLEVNDIEVMLERIKKSLAATKQAVAFLNKRRAATAQTLQ